MPVLYGTAGWSYKDWIGTVYPSNPGRGFNGLEFLSEKFDFVEVNTTFYRIPPVSLSQRWADQYNIKSEFSYWIKLNSKFTHQRNYESGDVAMFVDFVKPLYSAGKLEGILVQFPYSFKFGIQEMKYLEELFGYFGIFSLAVEFRHKSWNNPDLLSFFNEHGIVWVNIDQPVISASLPLTETLTNSEKSYIRLHGRNYEHWFSGAGRDERYNYKYSMKELVEIASVIKKLKEKAKKVFISGNNHYKGNAVKDLLSLKKLVN